MFLYFYMDTFLRNATEYKRFSSMLNGKRLVASFLNSDITNCYKSQRQTQVGEHIRHLDAQITHMQEYTKRRWFIVALYDRYLSSV